MPSLVQKILLQGRKLRHRVAKRGTQVPPRARTHTWTFDAELERAFGGPSLAHMAARVRSGKTRWWLAAIHALVSPHKLRFNLSLLLWAAVRMKRACVNTIPGTTLSLTPGGHPRFRARSKPPPSQRRPFLSIRQDRTMVGEGLQDHSPGQMCGEARDKWARQRLAAGALRSDSEARLRARGLA